MEDCVFCQIAKGELPADVVYEDDISVAFKDINPQAPVHVLVIPKKHIRSMLDVTKEDVALIGNLFRIANKIAEEKDISNSGFRLVINTGSQSGQSVWHIHIHLLGGRKMTWPPG